MTVDTLVLGYLDNNCYILSNNNKCLIIDPSDNGNVILNAIENKELLNILGYLFLKASVFASFIALINWFVNFSEVTYKIFDDGLLDDYEEMRETLVHELVHAFIMTYAISNKQFRDEEFICEFIAVYGEEIQKLANELMKVLYENEEN